MNALLAAALLLVPPPLSAGAAPVPTLDKDPAGYLRYVQTSPDPEAAVARREIAAGPAALARERAAARKEGLAVFPVQLNRPLPPDDQNAAPLYVKVAALRRGRVRLPNYAETLSARYAYTPAQLERIQKIYDDNPDVFALLRQATDRPQCVFARDWTNGAPGSLFTEFTGLRESAREITTESVLLAEKGRCAEAVQNQTRGYRLAEHAASDPILNQLPGGQSNRADYDERNEGRSGTGRAECGRGRISHKGRLGAGGAPVAATQYERGGRSSRSRLLPAPARGRARLRDSFR